MSAESPQASRYRILDRLGAGTMGVVHRAEDEVLGCRVALKKLRELSPDAIFRLKTEFRALAEFNHRNLVQLYDLVAQDDECFITMELLEGRDFVGAFRRDPSEPAAAGFERLRGALRQLVAGLGALHAGDKIHRDIKPTNVLVEHDGRVVLVDFGLVVDVQARGAREAEAGVLAGTPAYMPPEQIWGRPLTPAADWYAVGVMLYETLTGQLPPPSGAGVFVDGVAEVSVPRPRALDPEVPEDLDEIVHALLQPDPAVRPDGARVLAMLGGARSAAPPPPATPRSSDPSFVGRVLELRMLRRCFDSLDAGSAVVRITGPSGIGKTELVERFLAEREAAGDALVLRSRCHPHESLSFKAVDGLIDDLSRSLRRLPAAELEALLPPDVGVLGLLFPVFQQVVAAPSERQGLPVEIRRRGFGVLRELVARLGATRKLVLWIDDLQWGDLDSAALLEEMIRGPGSPRLLLVCSYRTDRAEGEEVIHSVFRADEVIGRSAIALDLSLPPLSDSDTRALAVSMLPGAETHAALDALVASSGGNPFLAAELAQLLEDAEPGQVIQFEGAVAARIERLDASARRLLTNVAVAGEPMVESVLFRLGGPPGEVRESVAALRSQRLLRTSARSGDAAVDTFHDRIRTAVLSRLSEEVQRKSHLEIARALETLPDADPQQLVGHYLLGGDREQAGEFAFVSAERSFAALAFNQAARLYRQALDLDTAACPRWRLLAKLGEALMNAGRGGEAAKCLAEAANVTVGERPTEIESLELRRMASERFLRSGLHGEGLELLREVLESVDLSYPRSPTTAVLSILVNRARVGSMRALGLGGRGDHIDPFQREVLEVAWSAGAGLSLFDLTRAGAFNVLHALLSQRAGDPGHLARALSTEGLLLAWEGGSRKERASRRRHAEAARFADESGDPNVKAHTLVMAAVTAFQQRRLRDALARCAEGEALSRERCTGAAWELGILGVLEGNSLACLGELQRLREHLPELLRQAAERDDRLSLATASLGYNNLAWLAADRPDEARAVADEALGSVTLGSFAWQVFQGAIALGQIDLYWGDGRGGFEQLAEGWRKLRRAQSLRFLSTRVEMRYLQARCALQSVAHGHSPNPDAMIRFAARAARRIDAEPATWVKPFADTLRAGILLLREPGRAGAALERTAAGFEALDMQLQACALRYRAAQLRGGTEGGEACKAQRRWMRGHGVDNPDRMAEALTPGPALR